MTDDQKALLRWRLALGPKAEQTNPALTLGPLDPGAAFGDLDDVLEVVYGERRRGGRGRGGAWLPQWLERVRGLFRHDVVALVQKDAIERLGLVSLLFEPETLPYLEKNVDLVATIVAAKDLVPDEAKAMAREIVAEVVEGLRAQFASEVRTAVLGALRRGTRSPLPLAANVDWKRTIRENLGGWDSARKRLLARQFRFNARQRRRAEWDVILVVDQSGSMAESVVYASVMAAIFASLDVLSTKLVVFDTEVVDLTARLADPVEVLFAAKLGGGTDIGRAVAYAETLVERPERTLLVLISDLFDGGDTPDLLARVRGLVDARVKVLGLLALSDGGQPAHNAALAATLVGLGVPCFGCSPHKLVEVMAQVMKGQELGAVGEAR